MSRAARTFRIAGKLVKFAFVLLIIFVNLLLIWRLFSVDTPSSMKALSPNEALVSAYERNGGEVELVCQEQRSITSAENNYGYFSVTRAAFIPSANQVQIVFRYNNSTLRHTQEDFSLESVPSRDEETYDVSLLLMVDKTPDDESDNFDNSPEAVESYRIHPAYFKTEQTTLYNYRLFVFDLGELDLAELFDNGTLLSVFADAYYVGAIDYKDTPYGTLCLYDYITDIKTEKLSGADKKAIESFNISK